jgi:hypothetical protein
MNTGSSDQMVGVYIGAPILRQLGEFAAPAGAFEFLLFYRVLELALLKEGLMCEGQSGGCGPYLTDCIFEALVTDPIRAIETIKTELAGFSLLDFSKIGVFGEAGWRCVYPSPNVRMTWLMDMERRDLALDQYQKDLAGRVHTVVEWLKGVNPEPGQKGESNRNAGGAP